MFDFDVISKRSLLTKKKNKDNIKEKNKIGIYDLLLPELKRDCLQCLKFLLKCENTENLVDTIFSFCDLKKDTDFEVICILDKEEHKLKKYESYGLNQYIIIINEKPIFLLGLNDNNIIYLGNYGDKFKIPNMWWNDNGDPKMIQYNNFIVKNYIYSNYSFEEFLIFKNKMIKVHKTITKLL